MTSAQRRNARMEKIFEDAKMNKAKYLPFHLLQILVRLSEKVERAYTIQRNGRTIQAEDWAELQAIINESKAIIERAKEGI